MKQKILIAIFFGLSFLASAQKNIYHGDFIENFSGDSLENFRYGSTGTTSAFKWKTGFNSTSEPGTSILSFKIDPQDSAGAGRGPEIISKDFTHFGTYSAKLKIPDVRHMQPNTGAVVGYFTYHVDSVPGLSEIDFEWLIADPAIIYIGTWTGHRGALKRIGRTINLAKGIIYNTIYKENYTGPQTPLAGLQNQPVSISAIEDYDASSKFYTYGFDWYPDRLVWWIMHPVTNERMVLWDYQGSQIGIPQNRTRYRMNFWHTNNWAVETNGNAIEKPLYPYELEVDWMSYSPLKK